MNLTKVRFTDLDQALQVLIDALSTHRHDGVEDVQGNPDIPGGARVSFLELSDIPEEIINNPSTLIVGEVPTPIPDGTETTFTLSNAVLDDNKEAVYLHGLRLAPGVDYVVNGDQIEFADPPPEDSNLLVDYQPVI